jgi:L-2-hydroxyglutarate oxidase LhgO
MSEKVAVAIIGSGVVGCFVAWELAKKYPGVYVFEKNPDIMHGENQSSRNSGVNHAGIYYDKATRPLKARLSVEGNRLWYEFCARYNLPCKKTGKLIVAVDEQESRVLDLYLKRAHENCVPGVRKISGGEAEKVEPNVRAYSALLVPTSGILEPTVLVQKLYAQASNSGAEFMSHTEVVGLKSARKGAELCIQYRDGNKDTVLARYVINAAGVKATSIASMLDPSFPLRPVFIRGDLLKFYRNRRPELYLRGTNVYPTPEVIETPSGKQFTVGAHLTPTFDLINGDMVIGDTVILGPKLVSIAHSEDYHTPVPPVEAFLKRTAFFPGLRAEDLDPHYGGVQARLNNYPDFYIRRDRICPQVIHLVGIDSPGLTSAPAIARYVAEMLERGNASTLT